MVTAPSCAGCGKEVDTSKSHFEGEDGLAYHNECVTPTATNAGGAQEGAQVEATPGNGDQNGSPTEETSSPTAESSDQD